MDQKPLLFFSFCLFLLLNSVAFPLYATEESPDREGSRQSTEGVKTKMEHEQEPLSSVNDLQTENRALREKVQEYKKLEEDLMAQRVYEKALRWDRIEKRPKSSYKLLKRNKLCRRADISSN